MPRLLSQGRNASGNWKRLEGGAGRWLAVGEDGFVPEFANDANLIVPVAVLKRRADELFARQGATGALLEAHEDPWSIAEHLDRLALIAIRFAKFSDGRGYSIARLLRTRYWYRGELRAVGDVLRDQLLFLQRCGFDTFELREDQDAGESLAAFGELPVTYHVRAA
jgi:uncharacterized protein (DUF934 family)